MTNRNNQPPEGTYGMGSPLVYLGEGGRGYGDIGEFLHIVRLGESTIWVGDVVRHPQNSADPGGGFTTRWQYGSRKNSHSAVHTVYGTTL